MQAALAFTSQDIQQRDGQTGNLAQERLVLNRVMALRYSATRFGKPFPVARDLWQPSTRIRTDAPNDSIRQLRAITRMARQQSILSKSFRFQTREFPADRRNINKKERIYYNRWHHLKYCTQVIRYSLKHQLRFRSIEEDKAIPAQAPIGDGIPMPNIELGRLLKDEIDSATKVMLSHKHVSQRKLDEGHDEEELRSMLPEWPHADDEERQQSQE